MELIPSNLIFKTLTRTKKKKMNQISTARNTMLVYTKTTKISIKLLNKESLVKTQNTNLNLSTTKISK
jgi:2-polyprenyl-3-methyl-5-hydroxy-6-metoxy-1,4-benzoquinol methylase